jgi:two-component system, OmpR family, phosphate regulon sensor histidine kinase PhoR
MTNAIIRRVIILGALAIASLLAIQTYWILLVYEQQESEFDRKVRWALIVTANKLSQTSDPPFALPSKDLVTRLYSNYYVVNINNLFKAGDLEHYLGESLEYQGFQEDFEYGMFDCSSNQMVAGKIVRYQSNISGMADEMLVTPLPAHYNSDFIYYFGVRFPGKNANILSNMFVVILFSVLMLLTVAFFIYSMFVILRQKQLSELQRDFINNMTHEFKTPISTINISTDVFLKNDQIIGDTRLHRYAGIIKEQTMRLNTQVEKVLQLAKIDRDKVQLNLEIFDLRELLVSLQPSMELKAGEKNGTLTLLLPELASPINADQIHLTNILHNLVDNAVKYARPDVPPDIRIGVRDVGRDIEITLSDNGQGISREHQKKVFDKFYRIPTGNVHNVKGFGLGLFYVREICKQHDWRLDLKSEVGKGSTFTIRMPRANA